MRQRRVVTLARMGTLVLGALFLPFLLQKFLPGIGINA
jgi:hypothetical protein